MGTDIHFYVEKHEDGGWKTADTWRPSEYEEGESAVPYEAAFYNHRNYDLFAILANVRNGFGFAGVDTGDGFVPICEPRGLPTDLSPELKAFADKYLEHTPSWVLVSELMAYDWTRTATKRGVVSGPEFFDWNQWQRPRGLGPSNYCGDVHGGGIEHVDMAEMDRRIEALKVLKKPSVLEKAVKSTLGSVYTRISWQSPYYRECSAFLSETLPRLWRVGSPDEVRCVFWFDS